MLLLVQNGLSAHGRPDGRRKSRIAGQRNAQRPTISGRSRPSPTPSHSPSPSTGSATQAPCLHEELSFVSTLVRSR